MDRKIIIEEPYYEKLKNDGWDMRNFIKIEKLFKEPKVNWMKESVDRTYDFSKESINTIYSQDEFLKFLNKFLN